MTNDELLSKTINYLRFPLIVGVVFIHNNMMTIDIQGTEINYSDCSWLTTIIYLFSNAVPAVCVPLFYFFSGNLFFYKTSFNRTVYVRKIKKRCSTLLVPYLIFNFLGFLIFLIQMHPSFYNIFPLLNNYRVDIVTFLSSFWISTIPKEMAGGMTPIDHPLWFVRDLFLMCIASPIVYYVIKRVGIAFLIAMGSFWFFQLGSFMGLPSIDHQPLFFFPLGAYFSIHHFNFVEYACKMKWTMYVFVFCVICDIVFRDDSFNIVFSRMGILLGIVALPCAVSLLIKGRVIKERKSWSDASFFIYALHGLFISKYMKVLILLLTPQSPFLILFIYFFVPISTIIICLIINNFLKRYLTSTVRILTGGR